MPFNISEQYHASVVQITGKFLGALEGAAFKEAINGLRDTGKTRLVIDLSKTDMMDSTGIGLMISTLTTMRQAGGDVCLAGMEKRIKNLFLLTRLLGPVFTDYETVEDALASFSEG